MYSCMSTVVIVASEAKSKFAELLDRVGRGESFSITPHRKETANLVEIHQHLTRLSGLPMEPDGTAWQEAWSATLLLAQQHKLTLYDAAYLEIALRHGIPLATQDAELRKAATAHGIALLPE